MMQLDHTILPEMSDRYSNAHPANQNSHLQSTLLMKRGDSLGRLAEQLRGARVIVCLKYNMDTGWVLVLVLK